MWIVFNVFIGLLEYCFYFMFCILSAGMWDPISLVRDQLSPPALEGQISTTGPLGSPYFTF